MRGDLRAVSIRSLSRVPRPEFSERIVSLRRRRERQRLERLEVIERLDRIERNRRRAGERVPDVAAFRRWW